MFWRIVTQCTQLVKPERSTKEGPRPKDTCVAGVEEVMRLIVVSAGTERMFDELCGAVAP